MASFGLHYCTRHLNQAGFRHPASQEPYLATLTVQAPHFQYLKRLPCEKSSSFSDSFLFFTFLPHFLVVPTPPLGARGSRFGVGAKPQPPQRLAVEVGASRPALEDGMVRQAAAGEALVGTLRLFRGGQRAWPRARRRGGRTARTMSSLSALCPRPRSSSRSSRLAPARSVHAAQRAGEGLGEAL